MKKNHTHGILLLAKFAHIKTTQEITKLTDQDNWSLLELTYDQETEKTVIDYIKDLGYDTIIMFENGQKNYAVPNPKLKGSTNLPNPTRQRRHRYSNSSQPYKTVCSEKEIRKAMNTTMASVESSVISYGVDRRWQRKTMMTLLKKNSKNSKDIDTALARKRLQNIS